MRRAFITPMGRRTFMGSALTGAAGGFACVPAVAGAVVSSSAAARSLPVAQADASSSAAILGAMVGGPAAGGSRGGAAIRRFAFRAPEEQLTDLKQRILATRWPERENDATQGVALATIRKLAEYWADRHDWRRAEAQLNALPSFVTRIDGVDIHFIHVRSKHRGALPVVVTHGWPGSVIEQLKLVGPLTDPRSHGGTAEDAFDVVIPSLPGYGFSGKPASNGWDPQRIARAWSVLMERLGYDRYVAQGGDWGNAVTEQLALQRPKGLIGIHTNMPATVPPEVARLLPGGPEPNGLGPEEKHAWDQLADFYANGLGYAQEMAGRPQTLYALADSPAGLAAWIIDHDIRSYNLIARVFEGGEEGLTRDDILDNITLYWLTNTAVSSARLYRESKLPFFDPKGVLLPTGVSAFRDEIYQAPESWTRRAYPNLVFYRRHDRGSHFAAWEEPQLLAQDLRETFRGVR